jgi:hypothetical protein
MVQLPLQWTPSIWSVIVSWTSRKLQTRHTLSDDGVLQGTAVLNQEDGVGVTTLGLASAGNTTAVRLHATVKGALDNLSLLVRDGTLGGGDRDRGALVEAEAGGGGRSRASRNGGGKGGDSGDDGELHVVGSECGSEGGSECGK